MVFPLAPANVGGEEREVALLMILLQDPTFTSTILHATDLGN